MTKHMQFPCISITTLVITGTGCVDTEWTLDQLDHLLPTFIFLRELIDGDDEKIEIVCEVSWDFPKGT